MSPTRLEDVRQLIHAYIKERPYSSHVIILGVKLTQNRELWKTKKFHLKVNVSM